MRAITLGVSFKQYLDIPSTVAWARAAAAVAREHPVVRSGAVRLFMLPSLPAVSAVRNVISDAPISIGAQDLHWADRGPYTGGVSGVDLVELGCRYVEVGHAERRMVFGEDAEVTRRKFAAALRNGLAPVLCVGERDEVDAETAAGVCIAQLESAFAAADHVGVREIVVAYEPEWAIGRAEPARPEHVAFVASAISEALQQEPWLRPSVVYGGSAKPGTLTALGGAVDGLFLGRFAHRVEDFARIIDEAAAVA